MSSILLLRSRAFTLIELLVAMGIALALGLLLVRMLLAANGLHAYTSVNTGLQQEELIWWQVLSRDLNGSSRASLSTTSAGDYLCMHTLDAITFPGIVRFSNYLTSYQFDAAERTLSRRQHQASANLAVPTDHPLRWDPGQFAALEGANVTRQNRVASHIIAFHLEMQDSRLVTVSATFQDKVPGRERNFVLQSIKTVRLDNP